jgi:hypothetical protein
MRFVGIRPFAIVSMLALLLGGQLCMIVDCAPRANAAATPSHSCCATASQAGHGTPTPAPARESTRPCCIAVALTAAPDLDRPLARELHLSLACLVATFEAVSAPQIVPAPQFPGESSSPPASPPRSAAGARAPPIA